MPFRVSPYMIYYRIEYERNSENIGCDVNTSNARGTRRYVIIPAWIPTSTKIVLKAGDGDCVDLPLQAVGHSIQPISVVVLWSA